MARCRYLRPVRAGISSPAEKDQQDDEKQEAWQPIVAPLGEMSSNAVRRAKPSSAFGTDLGCVRFGFPKGSLQQSTEELFARAGLPVKVRDRNYFPTTSDNTLQMVLFRSQVRRGKGEQGARLTPLPWLN